MIDTGISFIPGFNWISGKAVKRIICKKIRLHIRKHQCNSIISLFNDIYHLVQFLQKNIKTIYISSKERKFNLYILMRSLSVMSSSNIIKIKLPFLNKYVYHYNHKYLHITHWHQSTNSKLYSHSYLHQHLRNWSCKRFLTYRCTPPILNNFYVSIKMNFF